MLGACGSAPRYDSAAPSAEASSQAAKTPAARPATGVLNKPAATSGTAPRITRGGGYYLDDGPGDAPPADLDSIPDAVPKLEPLHTGAMKPYVVMGQSFTPMTELTPYKTQGIATWYGRRYHGKPTSSGEPYDMYGMSAAHPTLPIPSYVRVTNLSNGKSAVVRVNDRGPFIDNRLIDLSYTAAHRIGVLAGGSAPVEVESIVPDGTAPATGYAVANAPGSLSGTSVALTNTTRSTTVATARSAAPSQAPQADPILAIAAAARNIDPTAQAPSVASPQPGAAAPASVRDTGGIYLQLGAFGSRENAESYLARAKVQLDWLAERLHVLPREGLFRVHAGPYGTPAEARQIADRVTLAVGVRPVVVTR